MQDLPIAKNWKISFVWRSIVKMFNVIENCDPLVRDYHVTYNDGGKDLYQSQKIQISSMDNRHIKYSAVKENNIC